MNLFDGEGDGNISGMGIFLRAGKRSALKSVHAAQNGQTILTAAEHLTAVDKTDWKYKEKK